MNDADRASRMMPAGDALRTDSAESLPPAKGDSDLRGRTPDDVELPADTLLEVRGLKKYFPIRGGLLGRQIGAVRPSMAFRSGCDAARRSASSANPARARRRPGARYCA
jgi:hypothetical protein